MTARAMWKAEVCVGDERVPVKMYAAVRDAKVHFRLLHAKDHAPVEQHMVDAVCDRVVPGDEVQKGLEVGEGVFVVLTDQEREQLAPEPSRAIRVEQIVPAAEVDVRWFDRPYYLGPDGDDEAYFALAEALEERDALAIARWVLRKKRYHGALYGRHGYLMLATMRHADELVEVEGVRPDRDRAPNERELKLAEQLIATLEDDMDPEAFRNEYRDRVRALIEAKIEGREIEIPEPPPRRTPGSLMEDLQASLRDSKRSAHAR